MSAKYFRDAGGAYLGAFLGGAVPPAGAIEVAVPPSHAAQLWNGAAWAGAIPAPERTRAELLEAALIAKGVIAPADIDAEKSK